MNKEIISPKQAISMISVFLIGSTSLFIMGLEAKRDIWLAVLIAIAGATLILCMYARILSIFPEKDFFETLEILLGRPITIIVVLFLSWFAFDLGNIVLTNYGQFVNTVGLTETPITIIYLSMILICAFAAKNGIEALGRWSQIFVVLIIGFLLMVIPIVAKDVDYSNIRPTLYEGIIPVLRGSFGIISFPFAETVVFLLIFPAFKKGASKYKIFLKGLYIVGSLILVASTLEVMLFGPAYAQGVVYPSYLVLSIAKLGDIIDRIEIVAAAVFCLAVFLKITVLLIATCKGISYVFKIKNYQKLAFPVALMIVNFTMFAFSSVAGFHEWRFEVYPWYSGIFEIVIPILVFVPIEIRYRIMRKKGQLETVVNNP